MKTKDSKKGSHNNIVIISGKRYLRPSQAARRMGVSRATIYRRLSPLQAAGVEVLRTSERVTLVGEADLERYLATSHLSLATASQPLDALRQAQRIQAIIGERYGLRPAGWAAEAVRRVRESFNA
jgi:predicted DNA-binding transcriptional regulator YafY